MAQFARYSPFTRHFFNKYLSWNFRRSFSAIYSSGTSHISSLKHPLLFVANHVSWWDGFFLFELQRRFRPHARLFTIALKETCEKNPILTRMGVLPLEPGNVASVAALLKHLKNLRQESHPENFVAAFFPQGKIRPSFVEALEFQRGLEAIAKALHPIALVPVGIHIEPMVGKKPTAILQIEKPLQSEDLTEVSKIEKQVKMALSTIHQSLSQSGEKLGSPFERWLL